MKIRSRTRRELNAFYEEATRKKMEIPVTRYVNKLAESAVFNSEYPADLQVADGVAQCTWEQLTAIATYVHNAYLNDPLPKADTIAKALWLWQQEKRNHGNLEADVCDVSPSPTIEPR
jgi:hypothetical protein